MGESGILFRQPMPFPDPPTLFYARATDGSVCSLGTAAAGKTEGHVVEAGGRLYWTNQDHSPESDGSYVTTLMSANPDGTDSREILAQWNKHPIGDLYPHEYQGRLYCFLYKQPAASEEDGKHVPYLCRLHSERSDPVEIVRRLPDTASLYQFDGGYLYFVVRERSLWTAMTHQGSTAGEDTLCRVPLN